jgi:hypothetical protein
METESCNCFAPRPGCCVLTILALPFVILSWCAGWGVGLSVLFFAYGLLLKRVYVQSPLRRLSGPARLISRMFLSAVPVLFVAVLSVLSPFSATATGEQKDASTEIYADLVVRLMAWLSYSYAGLWAAIFLVLSIFRRTWSVENLTR